MLADQLSSIQDTPVMFPPGRARLATNPVVTGSMAATMTIGSSAVACFAAWIAGVPLVTMTFTFRRASSAAKPGRRSYRLSPNRDSMAMF